MTDLIAFLNARLDEDEAAAEACPLENWYANGPTPGSGYIGPFDWYLGGRVDAHSGKLLAKGIDVHDPEHHCLVHAARHDPARVLREVEAKRKLLELAFDADQTDRTLNAEVAREVPPGELTTGEEILRVMAAVYSDHPDYRQEWAP